MEAKSELLKPGKLTAQPQHCARAVIRKQVSNPAWSTMIPPRKADPLQPKEAIESTALHFPLLFCTNKVHG